MLETKPIDWDAVDAASTYDLPNQWCVNLVRIYVAAGYVVLFVTGRSEKYRDNTVKWMQKHIPIPQHMYRIVMRPDLDFREDGIVKQELYQRIIAPYFDVDFVVDDRATVVVRWRDIGLTCLQCAKGDY
jgi:acid phosphatase class B